MKLTRASSYAVHALAFLADQKSERPVASHLIAKARRIPELFLLKILKPLATARVLHSVRGPNGGYRLARPAEQITLLEVVEAVDGPIRGLAPLTEGDRSPFNRKLEAICREDAERIRKSLEKIKLSDLAGPGKK